MPRVSALSLSFASRFSKASSPDFLLPLSFLFLSRCRLMEERSHRPTESKKIQRKIKRERRKAQRYQLCFPPQYAQLLKTT